MKQYQTGDIINGIVFVSEISKHIGLKTNSRRAIFKCSCGRNFKCIIGSVVTGNTKSCGCWGAKSRSLRFTKHGLGNHPVYKVWSGIKTRCYNKKRIDYRYYGGMGIKLSEEFHDFKKFFDYVTELPRYKDRCLLNLTIDRIDVRKDYQRNNLRWATRKEQSLNQRRNSVL